jgi:hypothetical protein
VRLAAIATRLILGPAACRRPGEMLDDRSAQIRVGHRLTIILEHILNLQVTGRLLVALSGDVKASG